MPERSNREIVERYMKAFPRDFDMLAELRHPDFVEDWPQSGERIRGHEGYVKVHEAYPGGLPEAETHRIMGSEDRWVASPSFTLVRILGEGEAYTIEGKLAYPDGSFTHLVVLLELRGGKVLRATHYFADPFEPPAWRASLVERI
jgi:hypothetical protein